MLHAESNKTNIKYNMYCSNSKTQKQSYVHISVRFKKAHSVSYLNTKF